MLLVNQVISLKKSLAAKKHKVKQLLCNFLISLLDIYSFECFIPLFLHVIWQHQTSENYTLSSAIESVALTKIYMTRNILVNWRIAITVKT